MSCYRVMLSQNVVQMHLCMHDISFSDVHMRLHICSFVQICSFVRSFVFTHSTDFNS